MAHPLDRRLAALEARARPDQGLRVVVVVVHEDLRWPPEERQAERAEFSSGLPEHRGMTVIVRRFEHGMARM